ncbi:hypothetical protein [Streptomyces sp. ML-6]|uniref:hypothetical protein n=1 Tax=Streptomyces sp. ML-6 TaxID=2982693 RepID=UPI0024C0242A|nr:hypothetical protein [Streptomyces sp. ML-6]MDK0524220.1 hypothetical protein [Streptomyces sp. ML-6]
MIEAIVPPHSAAPDDSPVADPSVPVGAPVPALRERAGRFGPGIEHGGVDEAFRAGVARPASVVDEVGEPWEAGARG